MQPTVEDVVLQPWISKGALNDCAHPQRVSNRVEMRQLSCRVGGGVETSGAAPLLRFASMLSLGFFSLLIFISGHRPAHSCFFCCSSASRL